MEKDDNVPGLDLDSLDKYLDSTIVNVNNEYTMFKIADKNGSISILKPKNIKNPSQLSQSYDSLTTSGNTQNVLFNSRNHM